MRRAHIKVLGDCVKAVYAVKIAVNILNYMRYFVMMYTGILYRNSSVVYEAQYFTNS